MTGSKGPKAGVLHELFWWPGDSSLIFFVSGGGLLIFRRPPPPARQKKKGCVFFEFPSKPHKAHPSIAPSASSMAKSQSAVGQGVERLIWLGSRKWYQNGTQR